MTHDDVAAHRWLVLGLVVATTAVATAKLWAIFEVDGMSAEEVLLLVLFAVLFSWIAVSFWVACLGVYERWSRNAWRRSWRRDVERPPSRSRTVLAMPVYNEDCSAVFARIETMQDSLREAGAVDRFDFFVLSDSTDPLCFAAEEAAWHRVRERSSDARIYYRHRVENTGRKSGNIADFCMNWGAMYDYMVVLDADSLMTGRTLARLVALMDESPRAALIQVPPLLVGGESLFARVQQFASWVYGPVYAAGLAKLQGVEGNYWGHNAIIRVRPFMRHCGLPRLSGRPPLGGEILSHDFVEAALLCRAGWDVSLVDDLGGSYEASPPNLIDHLKRDHRWCQGNLQHVRLLFAKGLRMQSRLHMAFGAMSYLSSPLWLIMIALFIADAIRLETAAPVTFVGQYPVLTWPVPQAAAFLTLIAGTAFLLYVPKFLTLLLLLRDRETVRHYGGKWPLTVSALAEIVVSTLLAPVLMLSHTWFVANVLAGRTIEWGRQRRDGGGIGLLDSAVAFASHTILALVGGALTWYWIPGSLWFLPLFLGLALAAVLCWLTSEPKWGIAARRHGVFVVPSEAGRVPILDRVDAHLADARDGRSGDAGAGGGSWQTV